MKNFIGFILSTNLKFINLHPKNSTYAHWPWQNELTKLKIWIMDGTCTSIYEQFFVCFEVGISYRDLIYVMSYYKESRFFLNVKKWWTTKSYGLWMAWNGYVLYHIIFKFFSTFRFEDFLKWFFSYGLYPLHFDVFKDFQTWHLLGQIFWYRFWHKFIEFFKWVNI
jgi:hypothetical protein